MLELNVIGTIPVKKNRQRIGAHGGIYKPTEVREYEDLVGWEARIQKARPVTGRFTISGEVRIRSTKDLDGALTTILDCLQKNGLIENDKLLTRIGTLEKTIVQKGDSERFTIRVEAID